MNIIGQVCPKCKRSDGLGSPYRTVDGYWQRTCHGLNRDEHLGARCHFNADTGEVYTVTDGVTGRIMAAREGGEPVPVRGFHPDFLADTCGITSISSRQIELYFADVMKGLATWSREMEEEGFLVTMFPIHRGPRVVGLQFRALRPHEDRPHDAHQIRVYGQAEGLFVPYWVGRNPSAVVIFEGPWDAVAAVHEAEMFNRPDLFSVATLSAGVAATTIQSTLEAIFPGVPRFSVFDQDPAGVLARLATKEIAKPLLVTAAGDGKDYRELTPELRFERLATIVDRELKVMGLA